MTKQKHPQVAYFCMEYGLNNDFKIYSGGLGILAGDHLKGAKDAGLPLVGVGIKWRQGYGDQRLNAEGYPVDVYTNHEYPFLTDTKVTVKVRIRGRDVHCKVWKCDHFGNVPLYLLDTDVPENCDRHITGQLYGWFGEERVAQEMVLGIGGVRALRALNIPVDVHHLNEGHGVFAAMELLTEKMKADEIGFHEALELTRQQVVFTTHTPILAGNEVHGHELLNYMGANMGLNSEELHAIGGTPFNMTVAALRLSRKANAVAQLHGETSNDMWKEVKGRCEIIGITNAVHPGTWVDKKISSVVSAESVWTRHLELKKSLIEMVQARTGTKLNFDGLLIGFGRRAAPYKRSNLIFSDEQVIEKLFREKKLQIIFSGKAHPLDTTGKEIVHSIFKAAKKYPDSVVFLENYDMEIGAALTRGCDVWLNNPRRPLEASGTSGMKAAMNGVLNCSVLDGWWPEACRHGENGWAIGDEVVPATVEEQDERDAKALYRILLDDVIPTWYRDKPRWKRMMMASIESTKSAFAVDRMVHEYFDRLYAIPAPSAAAKTETHR